MSIQTSTKIYISHSQSDSQGFGRGVFAKEEIRNGTIIEECPLIEIPKHEL